MCGQDRCEKGSGMYANMIDMGHVSGSGGTKYPLAYEPQTGRFFRGYETPEGIQYISIKGF